jgi:cell filamentation protein
LAQLHRQPLAGDYDLRHLYGFHARIFGDVYPGAGEIRTVSISVDEAVAWLHALFHHLDTAIPLG